jgi:tetratricopeptide (TPR) repeat protein
MQVRTLVLIVGAILALCGCSSGSRLRPMPTAPAPPDTPGISSAGESSSAATLPPAASRSASTTSQTSTSSAGNTPSSPTPEATASPDQNLAGLYRDGLAAAKDGRHDEALQCWEQLWSESPDYEDVSELLKREYQVRGLERFAVGELDEAVHIWQKALAIDPHDRRTCAYIERADELRERSTRILRD